VNVAESRSLLVCGGITRTQIVQFAAASGDLSPLHTDEPAAIASGQPSLMAHGMMSLALAARVLEEWFGTAALRSLDVRFTAPAWPGDELTATATVIDEGELELALTAQDGRVVLSGTARVAVDTLSNPA
jgi:acyl dehydratase